MITEKGFISNEDHARNDREIVSNMKLREAKYFLKDGKRVFGFCTKAKRDRFALHYKNRLYGL